MSLTTMSQILGVCLLISTTSVWCRSTSRFASFSGTSSFDDQNSLSPIGGARGNPRVKDWVKVTQPTGRVVRVEQGGQIELECEAIGSPPPTVQWFRGNRPITAAFEESNSIGGFGLGKVISRLIIDCALPHHQATYTCAATSGGQTKETLPTAVIVEGNMPSTCGQQVERRPRMTLWSPVVLENIQNDVTLPCQATGYPKPKVFWVDEDNNHIHNSPDSRFKVLETGELVISRLRWGDMGGYMCVAENSVGKDTATTFLYPMLNED